MFCLFISFSYGLVPPTAFYVVVAVVVVAVVAGVVAGANNLSNLYHGHCHHSY